MVVTSVYKTSLKNLALNNIIEKGAYVAVGTSSTTPSESQTALLNEVYRKSRLEYLQGTNSITIMGFISSAEANGNTIREYGVFDQATSGTMLARWVDNNPINKTYDIEISAQIVFTISVSEV